MLTGNDTLPFAPVAATPRAPPLGGRKRARTNGDDDETLSEPQHVLRPLVRDGDPVPHRADRSAPDRADDSGTRDGAKKICVRDELRAVASAPLAAGDARRALPEEATAATTVRSRPIAASETAIGALERNAAPGARDVANRQDEEDAEAEDEDEDEDEDAHFFDELYELEEREENQEQQDRDALANACDDDDGADDRQQDADAKDESHHGGDVGRVRDDVGRGGGGERLRTANPGDDDDDERADRDGNDAESQNSRRDRVGDAAAAAAVAERSPWANHRDPRRRADIAEVNFTLMSAAEIRAQSVLEVRNAGTFLHGRPVPGGLFSPEQGPTDRNSLCGTCGHNSLRCGGHWAHLELAEPVVISSYLKVVLALLRATCHYCSRLLAHSLPPSVAHALRHLPPETRAHRHAEIGRDLRYCGEPPQKKPRRRREPPKNASALARRNYAASELARARTFAQVEARRAVLNGGGLGDRRVQAALAGVGERRRRALARAGRLPRVCSGSWQPRYDIVGLDVVQRWDDVPLEERPPVEHQRLTTYKILQIFEHMSPASQRALGFRPRAPAATSGGGGDRDGPQSGSSPCDLVARVLAVPPGSIRPSCEQSEGDGVRGHDDLTGRLRRIVTINNSVRQCKRELQAMIDGRPLPSTADGDAIADAAEDDDADADANGDDDDDDAAASALLPISSETGRVRRQTKKARAARRRELDAAVAIAKIRSNRRLTSARLGEAAMRAYIAEQMADLKLEIATLMDGATKVAGVTAAPLNGPHRAGAQQQAGSARADAVAHGSGGGGGGGGAGGGGATGGGGDAVPRGYKQRLSGKYGRFQWNAQGRRSGNSGRGVIVPDTAVPIAGVSAPYATMDTLTQPRFSTAVNRHRLLQSARRVRPPAGAVGRAKYVVQRRPLTAVERAAREAQERAEEQEEEAAAAATNAGKNGRRRSQRRAAPTETWRRRDLRLSWSENRKVSLRIGDILGTGCEDGDWLLLNRQPTLHKPSILAAQARTNRKRRSTIGVSDVMAPPMGGDYDGDEANLHLPETGAAQVEARLLMNVGRNLRSIRHGGAIITPVQNTPLALWRLTDPSTVVTHADACQMLAHMIPSGVDVGADLSATSYSSSSLSSPSSSDAAADGVSALSSAQVSLRLPPPIRSSVLSRSSPSTSPHPLFSSSGAATVDATLRRALLKTARYRGVDVFAAMLPPRFSMRATGARDFEVGEAPRDRRVRRHVRGRLTKPVMARIVATMDADLGAATTVDFLSRLRLAAAWYQARLGSSTAVGELQDPARAETERLKESVISRLDLLAFEDPKSCRPPLPGQRNTSRFVATPVYSDEADVEDGLAVGGGGGRGGRGADAGVDAGDRTLSVGVPAGAPDPSQKTTERVVPRKRARTGPPASGGADDATISDARQEPVDDVARRRLAAARPMVESFRHVRHVRLVRTAESCGGGDGGGGVVRKPSFVNPAFDDAPRKTARPPPPPPPTRDDTFSEIRRSEASVEAKLTAVLGRLRSQTGQRMIAALRAKEQEHPLLNRHGILELLDPKIKGEVTNLIQIMCMIGQQQPGDERIHDPPAHFSAAERRSGVGARGLVPESYAGGMRSDTMASMFAQARVDVIKIATSVADWGYVQKRMVKSCEDLMVQNDGSVRGARGNYYAACAGDDGFSAAAIERVRYVPTARKLDAAAFRAAHRWADFGGADAIAGSKAAAAATAPAAAAVSVSVAAAVATTDDTQTTGSEPGKKSTDSVRDGSSSSDDAAAAGNRSSGSDRRHQLQQQQQQTLENEFHRLANDYVNTVRVTTHLNARVPGDLPCAVPFERLVARFPADAYTRWAATRELAAERANAGVTTATATGTTSVGTTSAAAAACPTAADVAREQEWARRETVAETHAKLRATAADIARLLEAFVEHGRARRWFGVGADTSARSRAPVYFLVLLRDWLSSKRAVCEYGWSYDTYARALRAVAAARHRAAVEPGECVGTQATQSIGEPGTQMTLSTFRLVDSAVEALGFPRFSDIISATRHKSLAVESQTMTLFVHPRILARLRARRIAARRRRAATQRAGSEPASVGGGGSGSGSIGGGDEKRQSWSPSSSSPPDATETQESREIAAAVSETAAAAAAAAASAAATAAATTKEKVASPEKKRPMPTLQEKTVEWRAFLQTLPQTTFGDLVTRYTHATVQRTVFNASATNSRVVLRFELDLVKCAALRLSPLDVVRRMAEQPKSVWTSADHLWLPDVVVAAAAAAAESESSLDGDNNGSIRSAADATRPKPTHAVYLELYCNQQSDEYRNEEKKYAGKGFCAPSVALIHDNIARTLLTAHVCGLPGVRAAHVVELPRSAYRPANVAAAATTAKKTTDAGADPEDEATTEFAIQTVGSNFASVFALPWVDARRCATNHVFANPSVLGMSATRGGWIGRQLQAVMRHNGVNVNERHTQLVGEVMCHTGAVEPLGRFGVMKRKAPYHTIAYEECSENQMRAGVYGWVDKVRGVTEALVVGKPLRIGTGLNPVLSPAAVADASERQRRQRYLQQQQQQQSGDAKRQMTTPAPANVGAADAGGDRHEQRAIDRCNLLTLCRRTLHAKYEYDDDPRGTRRELRRRCLRAKALAPKANASVWDLVDAKQAETLLNARAATRAAARIERRRRIEARRAARLERSGAELVGLSPSAARTAADDDELGSSGDSDDDDRGGDHGGAGVALDPIYADIDVYEMVQSARDQQRHAPAILTDRVEVRDCGRISADGERQQLPVCASCSNPTFLPVCLACLESPPGQRGSGGGRTTIRA